MIPSCLVAGPGSSALSRFSGGRCPNCSPQLFSSREDEKPRFKHEWLQSPGEELKPQPGRDVVWMGFRRSGLSHNCWNSSDANRPGSFTAAGNAGSLSDSAGSCNLSSPMENVCPMPPHTHTAMRRYSKPSHIFMCTLHTFLMQHVQLPDLHIWMWLGRLCTVIAPSQPRGNRRSCNDHPCRWNASRGAVAAYSLNATLHRSMHAAAFLCIMIPHSCRSSA